METLMMMKVERLEAALAADSRHWRFDWHLKAKALRAALNALVTKIGEVHAHPLYGPELDAAIVALRDTEGIHFAPGEEGGCGPATS